MDQIVRARMLDAIAAANRSPYDRTHVGAVITNGGDKPMAVGFNDPVYGQSHLHAEVAAIVDAARIGLKTQGATMYATWASCPACAKAIVNAGIKTVYVLGKAMDKTDPKWRDEVTAGLNVLQEGGLIFRRVEENMDTILRMNGEWFEL